MRSIAALVLVGGCLPVFAMEISPSVAQDRLNTIDINAFFSDDQTSDDAAALQSMLGEGTVDDFILGGDGLIVSAQHDPDMATIYSHIGNNPSAPPTKNVTSEIPNIRSFDIAECGPSPYTADEIEQLVTAAAERHDVDISLATAVAYAESRFDRQRNSPAGARGPMQLMPDTAERFGVADVCDTPSNIDGGVRYLSLLTEQFGNPLLVAAAYNTGEQRIYEYGGVPPLHETVAYLATILNFQMGIEDTIPAKPSSTAAAGAPATNLAPPLSGIILENRPGEFVAGVMQF